jgi:predicted lipopolysaccharide heptosyltransferase III
MPLEPTTSTRLAPRALIINSFRAIARWAKRLFGGCADAPQDIAPQNIRRILWVRLDHIGDVVMSLPALHALRRRYPDAQIDTLVRPGCAALFENNADANRVLTYDSPRFPQKKSSGGAGFFRTLALIQRLRRRQYDVAIDMRGDDIARLLISLSGVPLRLGPERIFYESVGAPNFSFLMTHPVPIADEPQHAVQNNLELLRVLDVPANVLLVRLETSSAQRECVDEKLQQMGVSANFASIHACSNDSERNWQPERFAAVAEYLVEQHGLDVVLTGTTGDAMYNARIINSMLHSERAHNAAGCFRLQELPAFYERAKLMVTVDTGPMHIAAATGTPIVALFLPRLAPRHHPYGQNNGVVTGSEYSLDSVRIDDVLAAIEQKLHNDRPMSA